MALITWREFSTKSEIKSLPLHEQKKQFLWENQRRAEENWFLEAQLMNGGGGGGGFAGNASDGPLNGSTVTTDVGTTTTDALGNFTFPKTPTSEITVTGGTDSITGVAFTGELKGFPQYKTVSPLTTLAYHLKEEDATLTADTAVDLLFASSSTLFGIELQVADKDVMLNKDYVAESILADNQAAIAAQSIATYLESVTEMVGSAVKSADDSEKGENFTTNSAKVQGYKSIARQIQGTRGAKTAIEVEGLFDLVQRPNGQSFTRGVTGSLDTDGRQNIKSVLTNVRTQLGELSRSELYNANYLTTQIQAVNRGVKEDYKREAQRIAENSDHRPSFKSMTQIITESTGSLAQIESGRANETDANTSKKPSSEFFQLGGMTYTMQEKGRDAVTLSFKSDPGQMFVVGTEIQKGQFLNNESGAFNPLDSGNFVKAAPTIIATQVRTSRGKVYEITLANPGFQVVASQLKDPVKYLPVASGGYVAQEFDGEQWATSPVQPFTASVAANQTSTSATLESKLGNFVYELEYNSSTSRYEYSTTQDPPKGTKTLQAHIADFTNEAQWTNINAKDQARRFQIANVDTHHVASSGTYTISRPLAVSQRMDIMSGAANSLKTIYDKLGILIEPTDSRNAPNGPFTVTIDGTGKKGTNFNFTNNVLTFTHGEDSITYTVTYTTK